MQKIELIGAINEGAFTDDIKQSLLTEVATYPDELSQQEISDFDGLLAEIQEGEMVAASGLEQIATILDDATEALDANYEASVEDSVAAMKDGLELAQELTGIDSANESEVAAPTTTEPSPVQPAQSEAPQAQPPLTAVG